MNKKSLRENGDFFVVFKGCFMIKCNLSVFETERHAGRSLRCIEIFCREQPMCCSAKLQ